MSPSNSLDAYDKRILKSLAQDGKKPFSKIAADLGISNTMVHQRVLKLKELKRYFSKSIVSMCLSSVTGNNWVISLSAAIKLVNFGA